MFSQHIHVKTECNFENGSAEDRAGEPSKVFLFCFCFFVMCAMYNEGIYVSGSSGIGQQP